MRLRSGKTISRFLVIMLTVAFAVLFGGCGKDAQLTGVSFLEDTITIEKYETYTLSLLGAEDKEIEWKSEDKSKAEVKDGVVYAKKKGNTKITASIGKAGISCNIVVTDNGFVPTIDLCEPDDGIYLSEEGTYTLSPVLSYNGNTYTDVEYTYSADGSAIKVDKSGVVTALELGEGIVNVKGAWRDTVVETSLKVNVIDASTSIEVSDKVYDIYLNGKGEEYPSQADLGITIFDKNIPIEEKNASVKYVEKATDGDVEGAATIKNGVVYAAKYGTTHFVAEYTSIAGEVVRSTTFTVNVLQTLADKYLTPIEGEEFEFFFEPLGVVNSVKWDEELKSFHLINKTTSVGDESGFKINKEYLENIIKYTNAESISFEVRSDGNASGADTPDKSIYQSFYPDWYNDENKQRFELSKEWNKIEIYFEDIPRDEEGNIKTIFLLNTVEGMYVRNITLNLPPTGTVTKIDLSIDNLTWTSGGDTGLTGGHNRGIISCANDILKIADSYAYGVYEIEFEDISKVYAAGGTLRMTVKATPNKGGMNNLKLNFYNYEATGGIGDGATPCISKLIKKQGEWVTIQMDLDMFLNSEGRFAGLALATFGYNDWNSGEMYTVEIKDMEIIGDVSDKPIVKEELIGPVTKIDLSDDNLTWLSGGDTGLTGGHGQGIITYKDGIVKIADSYAFGVYEMEVSDLSRIYASGGTLRMQVKATPNGSEMNRLTLNFYNCETTGGIGDSSTETVSKIIKKQGDWVTVELDLDMFLNAQNKFAGLALATFGYNNWESGEMYTIEIKDMEIIGEYTIDETKEPEVTGPITDVDLSPSNLTWTHGADTGLTGGHGQGTISYADEVLKIEDCYAFATHEMKFGDVSKIFATGGKLRMEVKATPNGSEMNKLKLNFYNCETTGGIGDGSTETVSKIIKKQGDWVTVELDLDMFLNSENKFTGLAFATFGYNNWESGEMYTIEIQNMEIIGEYTEEEITEPDTPVTPDEPDTSIQLQFDVTASRTDGSTEPLRVYFYNHAYTGDVCGDPHIEQYFAIDEKTTVTMDLDDFLVGEVLPGFGFVMQNGPAWDSGSSSSLTFENVQLIGGLTKDIDLSTATWTGGNDTGITGTANNWGNPSYSDGATTISGMIPFDTHEVTFAEPVTTTPEEEPNPDVPGETVTTVDLSETNLTWAYGADTGITGGSGLGVISSSNGVLKVADNYAYSTYEMKFADVSKIFASGNTLRMQVKATPNGTNMNNLELRFYNCETEGGLDSDIACVSKVIETQGEWVTIELELDAFLNAENKFAGLAFATYGYNGWESGEMYTIEIQNMEIVGEYTEDEVTEPDEPDTPDEPDISIQLQFDVTASRTDGSTEPLRVYFYNHAYTGDVCGEPHIEQYFAIDEKTTVTMDLDDFLVGEVLPGFGFVMQNGPAWDSGSSSSLTFENVQLVGDVTKDIDLSTATWTGGNDTGITGTANNWGNPSYSDGATTISGMIPFDTHEVTFAEAVTTTPEEEPNPDVPGETVTTVDLSETNLTWAYGADTGITGGTGLGVISYSNDVLKVADNFAYSTYEMKFADVSKTYASGNMLRMQVKATPNGTNMNNLELRFYNCETEGGLDSDIACVSKIIETQGEWVTIELELDAFLNAENKFAGLAFATYGYNGWESGEKYTIEIQNMEIVGEYTGEETVTAVDLSETNLTWTHGADTGLGGGNNVGSASYDNSILKIANCYVFAVHEMKFTDVSKTFASGNTLRMQVKATPNGSNMNNLELKFYNCETTGEIGGSIACVSKVIETQGEWVTIELELDEFLNAENKFAGLAFATFGYNGWESGEMYTIEIQNMEIVGEYMEEETETAVDLSETNLTWTHGADTGLGGGNNVGSVSYDNSILKIANCYVFAVHEMKFTDVSKVFTAGKTLRMQLKATPNGSNMNNLELKFYNCEATGGIGDSIGCASKVIETQGEWVTIELELDTFLNSENKFAGLAFATFGYNGWESGEMYTIEIQNMEIL